MLRKTLDVPFEFKEVTDQGKFSGIASIYGAVDLGGDVVERGAFAKTLSDNPVVPILWQHNPHEVIGEGKIRSTREGLMVEGELDIETDAVALKAYNKMRKKRVKGLSIGYQSVKEDFKNNIRHLQEVKLWEISVVTFPMLPGAQVTGVKSIDEIKEFLEQFWANEAGIKAAVAADSELKQRFLTLFGEAGSTTSTKTAVAPAVEPLSEHSTKKIQEILEVCSRYGTRN